MLEYLLCTSNVVSRLLLVKLGFELSQFERSCSKVALVINLFHMSQKGVGLGHILLLNTNMKSYCNIMVNPTICTALDFW